MRTLLVLAGTREARHLVEVLQDIQSVLFDTEMNIVASLAGVTSTPQAYECETRTGGFGGIAGLRAWIEENDVCAVVDATHPFAAQISANSASVCTNFGIPRICLHRAPWKSGPGWTEFETAADLAAALPAGARTFLTTGHGELHHFMSRDDINFLLRTIEPLQNLPPHFSSMLARPPFTIEEETALLVQNRITHLVTKNAGGARPAKLDAAMALGIKIFSVAMPPPPPGDTVSTVEEAVAWVGSIL